MSDTYKGGAEVVLVAGYVVRGTRYPVRSELNKKVVSLAGYAVRGTQ